MRYDKVVVKNENWKDMYYDEIGLPVQNTITLSRSIVSTIERALLQEKELNLHLIGL